MYPFSINNLLTYLLTTHTNTIFSSLSSLCMAANSSCRAITAVGKRVANRICTSNSPSPPLTLTSRRGVAAFSSSVYDKNPDDQVHAGPVPDDVIQATHSTKYWAPHPQTGVFGPPGEQVASPATAAAAAGERIFHSDASTTPNSVLEEKAWFRPTSLEDLEKPNSLP